MQRSSIPYHEYAQFFNSDAIQKFQLPISFWTIFLRDSEAAFRLRDFLLNQTSGWTEKLSIDFPLLFFDA